MNAILNFDEVTHLLVYFPLDTSFFVCPVQETGWNIQAYEFILENPTGKVRIPVKFEDEEYSAIIVQCSSDREHLDSTLNHVCNLKSLKLFHVETILSTASIPRFVTGKRIRYPCIKVSSFNDM